jgi:glyoxylase-like metal-dependent hydrolase (beta-lactamase superfamily II)
MLTSRGDGRLVSGRRAVLVTIVVAMVLLTGGVVWAVVPTSTFGYVTLCHRADTSRQETLIIPEGQANGHIRHGDPEVRCADPIPDTAGGVAIDPAKGYFVEEISDGVYWVTEGTYQVMFVTTGAGVIVVDAPPSIGANILTAIAEVTDEPITHVIYSHSHADHISAAGLYPEDATYIAHEETAAQLLRDRPFPYGIFVGGGPVPPPDVVFSDSFTLTVGTQTLELDYRGPNHEPGNIFIHAPAQGVLMLVDVIFPAWSPFADLGLAEDVPGYYQAHEDVLGFDFDVFIGGHLTRLGSRADVELASEYILDIQANAAAALQQVDFFAIAEQTGFENQWLLFSTYLDAVAARCADLTVPAWTGRLAAVDIWTYDHCWKVVESLRID